jgi:large subunit ribosomal protein L23
MFWKNVWRNYFCMGILKTLSQSKKATTDVVDESSSKQKKVSTKKVKNSVDTQVVTGGGLAYRVLIRPFLSEKATTLESQGTYVFVVDTRATKEEIKRAVYTVYGVMPVRVRTSSMEGKQVRFGKSIGRRSDWKKAMVTLRKGESIQIHEGV